MVRRYDTVTFLSDYGAADEFVGVVKSVIRPIAPHVTVIDLTHEIPPYDVRAGSLTLARSVQYLAPASCSPSSTRRRHRPRRAVGVEVGRAATARARRPRQRPAGPGGGDGRRRRPGRRSSPTPTYHLAAPGPTFAGRDMFAPAAAHLCTRRRPGRARPAGRPDHPAARHPAAVREEEGDALAAEVLWVDRFGNVQLNVDPDELDARGERIELTIEGRAPHRPPGRTFADVGVGNLGLLVDSYGLLAVVADRSSAAGSCACGGRRGRGRAARGPGRPAGRHRR